MAVDKNLVVVAVVLAAVAAGSVFAFQFLSKQVTDFQSCADAGYPVTESFPMQCAGPDGTVYVQEIPAGNITETDEELVSYFMENLWSRGVENLGAMPIEGFDPDLYMGAFPGLEKSDFDNVAAIGGVWTHNSTSDELEFVRTEPLDQITSADGTISEDGMPALLGNIAGRLEMDVTDRASVDRLLDAIEEE